MEDIINRGGGYLLIQLFNATSDEGMDTTKNVSVAIDGVRQNVKAGGIVRLAPGESITLEPHCYHELWGEGRVLVGEVSLVNDDNSDNRFHKALGRFPTIEEDVPPQHLLCTDYQNYYQKK